MTRRRVLTASRLVATVTVLTSAAGTAVGQDVTLQYRWNKGEEIRYRLVNHTTTLISGLPGGPGEMNVELNVSQVLRTRVDDVTDDGTATLDYRFESARWEMTSPMGTMTYDSSSPDTAGSIAMPATLKDVLSATIGESFVIVISRQGQIQRVEGMDRLFDRITKSLPANPVLAPILQAVRSSFSDEGMRSAFAHSFNHFPDRALKPGDTWETQSAVSTPIAGRLITTTGFTLKSLEGGSNARVATIGTTLTMTNDPTSGDVKPLGLGMQFGESSGEGDVVFDVSRGRVQRATMRMMIPMQMSRAAPDGSAFTTKTVVTSVVAMELLP